MVKSVLKKKGFIFASTALVKSQKKRKNTIKSVLIKTQKAIIFAKNKTRKELYKRRV
jgi:hypothetical protein